MIRIFIYKVITALLLCLIYGGFIHFLVFLKGGLEEMHRDVIILGGWGLILFAVNQIFNLKKI